MVGCNGLKEVLACLIAVDRAIENMVGVFSDNGRMERWVEDGIVVIIH